MTMEIREPGEAEVAEAGSITGWVEAEYAKLETDEQRRAFLLEVFGGKVFDCVEVPAGGGKGPRGA